MMFLSTDRFNTSMIRRRLFIFFIFSFTSFNGISQENTFKQKVDFKGSGSKVTLCNFSDRAAKRNAVFLQKEESVTGVIVNPELKLLKSFSSQLNVEEKMIGGFISDDNKAVLILKNEYGDSYHQLVYDLSKDETNEFMLEQNYAGKKLVARISSGGAFYNVLVSKKSPVITLYQFKADGTVAEINYNLGEVSGSGLSEKELWMALSHADGLSRSADIAWVKEGLECDVEVAKAPNKLYLRNNKLVLVMDGASGSSAIFFLDLKDSTSTYRTITRNVDSLVSDEGLVNSSPSNSYLLGNTLYFLYATSNSMSLFANDFDTGLEKKLYSFSGKDSLSIKNTPVMQDGSLYFSDDSRELTSTKQLLRKMYSGRAVLTGIVNKSNQHELTIGAYKEVRSGGAPVMVGGGMAGGGLGMTAPVMMFTPSRSWSRITRFKTLLDSNTAEHIIGQVTHSPSELADEYAEGFKIPDNGSGSFISDDHFYFSYYDRDTKELVITRLQ